MIGEKSWMFLLGLSKRIRNRTRYCMYLKRKQTMIDTVCLLIPKNQMTYLSGVANWELYSKTDQYTKFVRNPSRAEKDTGKYFPRLTSYQRMFAEESVRL